MFCQRFLAGKAVRFFINRFGEKFDKISLMFNLC